MSKTLIHKNLHNGLWAITQKGVVVGYCSACTLVDWDSKLDAKKAAFSRSGNKRTVHLWARGTLVSVTDFVPLKGREVVISDIPKINPALRVVHYNPKRQEPGFMVDGIHTPSGKIATFNDVMRTD